MKNEERIKDITKNLLQSAGIEFETIDCQIDEKRGFYLCEVKGGDHRDLVGKDGEHLDSITHLVRRLCEKEGMEIEVLRSVFIETNGYLKEKIKNLETVAHMMAERARFFKKDTELEPMRAFDRKIVHTFLEGRPNVKTESIGLGSTRRIVVKYFE